MNIRQNPFSVYDFLGYLIPGAVFLYGFIFFIGFDASDNAPIKSAIDFVKDEMSFKRSEIYIPFVLLSYTLGHLLSFFSTITIERFSIWKFGYPSKYLLQKENITSDSNSNKEKNEWFIRSIEWIIKSLVKLFLFPIAILNFLCAVLGLSGRYYAKPLDDFLIDALEYKIKLLINEHACVNNPNMNSNSSDYFRYVYHYAVENATNHLAKMQNYVTLYGFLRTITFISVIVFWFIVWYVFFSRSEINLTLIVCINLAAVFFVTFFLFLAFVKFYRRFTLEALMAMSVTYPTEGKQSSSLLILPD